MARHTTPILAAAVVATALSLHPASASACVCSADSLFDGVQTHDPRSPCAEASGSDTLVFVGTVLTEERIVLPTHIPRFPEEQGRKLGFSVHETLVGTSRQFVYIITSSSSCGYPFRVGDQYLVYAAGSEESGFGTGACSRTSPLAQGPKDLVLLRELKSGTVRPRIFGRVTSRLVPPLPTQRSSDFVATAMTNVVVIAEGQGRREQAVTDAEGWFEIVGLKPGRYTVQAQAPTHAPPVEPQRVTLDNCGADVYFNFDLPRH